jgi:hypothetical protein
MKMDRTPNYVIDRLKILVDAWAKSGINNSYYSPSEIQEQLSLIIEDDPLHDDDLFRLLETVVVRTPNSASRLFSKVSNNSSQMISEPPRFRSI